MSEEEIALKILEISVGGNSRNVDYCVDDYFTILKRVHDENIQELKDKYSDEKIRDTVIKRYREVIEKDYISKDKIREKIKRYNEWIKEGGDYVESLEEQRYALNELLEE